MLHHNLVLFLGLSARVKLIITPDEIVTSNLTMPIQIMKSERGVAIIEIAKDFHLIKRFTRS